MKEEWKKEEKKKEKESTSAAWAETGSGLINPCCSSRPKPTLTGRPSVLASVRALASLQPGPTCYLTSARWAFSSVQSDQANVSSVVARAPRFPPSLTVGH
jgi:hypothetical protein